jgi:hypothetical protein
MHMGVRSDGKFIGNEAENTVKHEITHMRDRLSGQ